MQQLKKLLYLFAFLICNALHANEVDMLMRNDSIPISYKIKLLGEYFEDGLETGNEQLSFLSALGLVSIYTNQEKNADSAKLYLTYAYELLPKIKSKKVQSKFYYISGSIELKAENFTKALTYLLECQKIVYSDEKRSSYNLPILYNSIGVAYYNLNESDSAIFYIESAFSISLQNGDTALAVQTLGNIANIISEDDLSKLESIIEKLQELLQSIEDPFLQARVYQIFSGYFIKKKDFRKAKSYLDQAYKLANTSEKQLAEVYLDFSRFYEATNRPDSALNYYKNYVGLRDSLRQKSKDVKLANFESFYKAKLKEEEIRTEKEKFKTFEEKSKRRELWYYSIIIGSVLLLGVLSLYFLRLIQKTKQRKLNYKKEKEIQKLKIENISHELKNKEKDLSNIALDIARRNEFATKVYQELASINRKRELTSIQESVKKLQRYVRQQEKVNKNLEHLQIETDKVNFEFYQKLDQLVPGLSKKEKQLCAFIRMELTNPDIASLMGISPDTLKNNKSKLKKKFDLEPDQDFNVYISVL